MSPEKKNPYGSAAGAYEQHSQSHTNNPRELEARVLLKAVRKMQDLQARWEKVAPAELEEVLRYNRQIWTMFVDTAVAGTEGHSLELRNNIANLGVFIFKHSMTLSANPVKEKLNILIEINREIAAGLMANAKASEIPPAAGDQRISAET